MALTGAGLPHSCDTSPVNSPGPRVARTFGGSSDSSTISTLPGLDHVEADVALPGLEELLPVPVASELGQRAAPQGSHLGRVEPGVGGGLQIVVTHVSSPLGGIECLPRRRVKPEGDPGGYRVGSTPGAAAEREGPVDLLDLALGEAQVPGPGVRRGMFGGGGLGDRE